MKRYILLITLHLCILVNMNAQILRMEELQQYAVKEYGEKWESAASKLASEITLDKNNALTYVQIIDSLDKTKEQLYVLLNYWFTSTFNDANSVINLNDKELGTIIAQGYIANIAEHVGGANSYYVSISPTIKCDIKDAKVRVTYSVPFYVVTKMDGGGIFGKFSDTMQINENWVINQCYPFNQKDSHKKTSSKALIMAYAYSNVVMDKIEECVKSGMVGNEIDDW